MGLNFLQKIVFLLLPLIAASGCINDFYDLKINKAANTESTELFDAFVSENISFSGCSNSGYSHLSYNCTPSVTAVDAGLEWSLDPTNTCTFFAINSLTGAVTGGPNKNEPVTCDLVFRITTPTLTGKYSKSIKFAQGVSRYGVAYKAVATYQQYSYWGVDSRIDVFDSTTPSNPTYVGFQSAIWGVTGMSMHIHGQFLYVTTGGGMSAFSLADPSKPKIVSHVGTGAAGMDIAFYGNYALLANKANGVVIIDISNPAKAKVVTTIDTTGDAQGIKIRGNHAYVTDFSNDLVTIDLTDINNPSIANQLSLPAGNATNIVTNGIYAFVSYENSTTIDVINLTTPALPAVVHSFTTTSGNVSGMTIDGNVLHVGKTNGYEVFDISNPLATTSQAVLNSTQVNGKFAKIANTIYAAGTRAFAYDVSTPFSPVNTMQRNIEHNPWGLFVKDDIAVSISPQGSKIFDISDRQNPTVITDYAQGASGLVIEGNNLFFSQGGTQGLSTLNFSVPAVPVLTNFAIAGNSRGLASSGNYLYLINGATTSDQIHIIDVSTPTSPVIVNTILSVASPNQITIRDNVMFVASSLLAPGTPLNSHSAGVYIFDITDPVNPVQIGVFTHTNNVTSLALDGNKAYIGTSVSVEMLDITSLASPVWLGIGDVVWAPGTLAYYGGNVYFAAGWSGTRRVNVSDPTKIYYDGAIYTGDHPYVARTDENGYLYIAGYRNGFHIIKLSP